jgi:hypothetical protein
MDVFSPAFDLKQSLDQDASGQTLAALRTALLEGHRALDRSIDQGLPPKNFQAAARLKDALALAEEIITEYWMGKNSKI